MEVVLATANEDKAKEIREILPDGTIRFLTLTQSGFVGKIVETGQSFTENALIKARTVHSQIGGYVLADDSGLSIDVLGGAPGIHSARFAGENADYPEKIAKLYKLLAPWPPEEWLAGFVCVMALVRPDGRESIVCGVCRGQIAPFMRGDNGFGYDPIFLLPDRGLTMAQISPEEKHRISHRGRALRQIAELLRAESVGKKD